MHTNKYYVIVQINVNNIQVLLRNYLRPMHSGNPISLHILQKCFHLSLIKPFYRNLKKELNYPYILPGCTLLMKIFSVG
jgi:hypothetical protein